MSGFFLGRIPSGGGLWRSTCLALFVLLGACESAFGPNGTNELEAARARWSAAAVSDYSFSLRRSCFCPPESIGPVLITVSNGQVVARTLIEAGIAVSDQERWPAMEGVFDYAERALREADEATVEFHPQWGYPTQITVDWIRQAVDDEESLTVLSFEPASP